MSKTIQLEGFEGQLIEVRPPALFSGARLLMNGQPALKGPKRGQMLLTRSDGRQVFAFWKPQLFDVPQLVVDGKTVEVVKPLKWYQWLWSALPIVLVFIGGALGALCGFIAFTVNANIFRSELPQLLKFLLTGVISVLSFFLYLILASYLLSAVRP